MPKFLQSSKNTWQKILNCWKKLLSIVAPKKQAENWYKNILSLPEDEVDACFNLGDMTFALIENRL
jgi:hypothetical protein